MKRYLPRSLVVLIGLVVATGPLFAQPLFAQENDPPSVESLARDLSDGDVNVRRDAAYALSALRGDALPALDSLIKALGDKDEQVVLESLRAIDAIGSAAIPAAPELILGLDNWNPQRQYRASHALSQLGAAVLPELIEALSSNNAKLRQGAARACGWMGNDAIPAMEKLVGMLGDGDQEVRSRVAESLAQIGSASNSDKVELAVLQRLIEGNKTEQSSALAALAGMSKLHRDSAQELQKLFQSDDEQTRVHVLLGLAVAEFDDQQLMPLILTSLEDESATVRDAALVALRKVEPGIAQESLAAMVELLKSSDPGVRTSASVAICSFTGSAESVMPSLMDLLGANSKASQALVADQDDAVVRTIAGVGVSAIPLLVRRAAASGDSAIFISPIRWMGPQSVEPLQAMMVQDDVAIKRVAVHALASLDPPPSNALPPLRKALQDSDTEVASRAAAALGNFGVAGRATVDELIVIAGQGSPVVAREAIVALARIAPQDKRIMPLIEQMLASDEPLARVAAFHALSLTADDPSTLLPRLIDSLHDDLPEIRAASAESLAKLGEKAGEAIGPLSENLQAEQVEVRRASLVALTSIGSAAATALPQVAPLLKDSDSGVQGDAIAFMCAIGTAAASMRDQIAPLMNHELPEIRQGSYRALVALEPEREDLVPMLIAALDDSDWGVRQAAVELLGGQGPRAISASGRLFEMLLQDQENASLSGAIKEIDGAASAAIPTLISALNQDNQRIRGLAIFLLGKVGPEAKEALPKLNELLKETRGRGRSGLEKAIAQIEGRDAGGT